MKYFWAATRELCHLRYLPVSDGLLPKNRGKRVLLPKQTPSHFEKTHKKEVPAFINSPRSGQELAVKKGTHLCWEREFTMCCSKGLELMGQKRIVWRDKRELSNGTKEGCPQHSSVEKHSPTPCPEHGANPPLGRAGGKLKDVLIVLLFWQSTDREILLI